MSEILDVATDCIRSGEQCVLCTLVRLDGSGYGRPGARLLLTESGERVGFISGGCLERDLSLLAWPATEQGPRLIAFDTRREARFEQRYNAGCEGVLYVLYVRLRSIDDFPLSVLRYAQSSRKPTTLLTVYRSNSKLAHVGDMAVARADGTIEGPARGFVEACRPVLELVRTTDEGKTLQWISRDGARVEAAIEVHRPQLDLVIFGAGDDVVAVHRAASALGWRVTIVDKRPERASPVRFPGAIVHSGPWTQVCREVELEPETQVLLMTHDLEADLSLVATLLDSSVGSIGVMGSKRRLARLVATLYQQGRSVMPREAIRLRSPIGLDIGAVSPAEIAASIVAELLASLRGRSGGALNGRTEKLHDDVTHVMLTETSCTSDQIVSAGDQLATSLIGTLE